jgi:hypothetical protein
MQTFGHNQRSDKVVINDGYGGKDVLQGRDGRMDMTVSYQTRQAYSLNIL